MVGIQIGKEQEERKREEEGLDFETTPWWNFITIMGYADEELRSASLLKLRAQPTAKAKMHHSEDDEVLYYLLRDIGLNQTMIIRGAFYFTKRVLRIFIA